jgi:hypothetical protein
VKWDEKLQAAAILAQGVFGHFYEGQCCGDCSRRDAFESRREDVAKKFIKRLGKQPKRLARAFEGLIANLISHYDEQTLKEGIQFLFQYARIYDGLGVDSKFKLQYMMLKGICAGIPGCTKKEVLQTILQGLCDEYYSWYAERDKRDYGDDRCGFFLKMASHEEVIECLLSGGNLTRDCLEHGRILQRMMSENPKYWLRILGGDLDSALKIVRGLMRLPSSYISASLGPMVYWIPRMVKDPRDPKLLVIWEELKILRIKAVSGERQGRQTWSGRRPRASYSDPAEVPNEDPRSPTSSSFEY